MTNISLLYKVAGIASSAIKKTVTSVTGGTALFNLATAYKDYKEGLYQALSGLPPEEVAKISFFKKMIRTPPTPGSKVRINVLQV
ncbi:MAG: hypothetical protein ABIM30_00650 [candidate division WOR-3 bacterium]